MVKIIERKKNKIKLLQRIWTKSVPYWSSFGQIWEWRSWKGKTLVLKVFEGKEKYQAEWHISPKLRIEKCFCQIQFIIERVLCVDGERFRESVLTCLYPLSLSHPLSHICIWMMLPVISTDAKDDFDAVVVFYLGFTDCLIRILYKMWPKNILY